jgi:hypothetical protein
MATPPPVGPRRRYGVSTHAIVKIGAETDDVGNQRRTVRQPAETRDEVLDGGPDASFRPVERSDIYRDYRH